MVFGRQKFNSQGTGWLSKKSLNSGSDCFLQPGFYDALNKRNILTAVYIDFKCAYDFAWREKLYKKLHDIGVSGNLFKHIKSFTDQRFCHVRYGNE